MPLCVAHVCGPLGSGKSTAALAVASQLRGDPPLHVELLPVEDGPPSPLTLRLSKRGKVEQFRCTYSPERLLEQVPQVLRTVKQHRRWAIVLLETDSDPAHLFAHDYDLRVFVMAAPHDLREVFRSAAESERAMAQLMQESGIFMRERYGVRPHNKLDDTAGAKDDSRSPPLFASLADNVRLRLAAASPDAAAQGPLPAADGVTSASDAGAPAPLSAAPADRRPPMPRAQVQRLMQPEIGADLALRVRLRPKYQAILDSDVVIVNTGLGGCGAAVDEAARRIDALLRGCAGPERSPLLAVCDLRDKRDPLRWTAARRAAELINGVTARWP